jgi:tRNA-splicing ligase RtcB
MFVIKYSGLPIKTWMENSTSIESGAWMQAMNLADLPFAFKHIAIMPDAHLGYGMPIGGVLATEGVVIPNAVGVDIGCGMSAAKTNLTGPFDTEKLKQVLSLIHECVPVGFAKHEDPWDDMLMPVTDCPTPVVEREYHNACKSLGTLGGGNHFIELQVDEEEQLWVMIHSGSRNLGYTVANHYNKVAVELNKRWYVKVPREHDLAFLPLGTDEANQYQSEMDYCVQFALANRSLMMDRVWECLSDVFRTSDWSNRETINIAHNYAQMEHHFGKNVMVHRKGATSAKKYEIGIIPGSQGTPSYIVRGLGNRDSFMSCSHGAGRKMGRKAARRELSLEKEQAKLDGILHSVRGENDLDEAPGAYKDIDEVMANQSDLVEIVTQLRPLAVVKG